MAEFPHQDEVEVIWRSYQLMPFLETDATIDIYQLLARKGYDRQSVVRAHDELKQKGQRQGIVFNFEKIVVANTLNAHRLMHFAKESGKQDQAQERVFSAHFTEGRNVDDHGTLIALGEEIGLDASELAKVLQTGAYADAIRADIDEARRLDIEGVPHFLFDRKHEVIGAEGSALLLQMLEKAFEEWKDFNSRSGSA
jgi:protein disulfide-isomerase